MTLRYGDRSYSTLGPVHTTLVRAATLVSLLNVVLGVLGPPGGVGAGVAAQLIALTRVLLASVTVATLLLGPGIVLRGVYYRAHAMPAGFIPLPGIGVLSVVGAVTLPVCSVKDCMFGCCRF